MLAVFAGCTGGLGTMDADLSAPPDAADASPQSSSPGHRTPPPTYEASTEAGACGTACGAVIAIGGSPSGVVVDETDVVWGSTNVRVAAYQKATGAVRFIGKAEGVTGAVVMDSTNVYWNTPGAVFTCPRSGCPDFAAPKAIARGVALHGLAIDAENVYFGDHKVDRIYGCPLATGCSDPAAESSMWIDGAALPGTITVRNGTLYWTSTLGKLVASCAVSDCSATRQTLAAGLATPDVVLVDDGGIYWSELGASGEPRSGRVVHRRPDGAITTLASRVHRPTGLAMDASTLYWQDDGWIVGCAKTGCSGTPTRIAHCFGNYADALAVDETYVYWTEPGFVVRAKKN